MTDLSAGPDRGFERKDLGRETRGFVAFSLLRAISVHALNDACRPPCRWCCWDSAAFRQPLTLRVAMVYNRFSEFRQLRAGWKGLPIGLNGRGRIPGYSFLLDGLRENARAGAGTVADPGDPTTAHDGLQVIHSMIVNLSLELAERRSTCRAQRCQVIS